MAPPGRESLLFTPGPLTTSATVKQAACRDLGSRDVAFVNGAIKFVRDELLTMAHTSTAKGYQCGIVQGSGTFAVESVVSSIVGPPESGDRILVVSNGAYGKRMKKMCEIYGIAHDLISYSETDGPTPADIRKALTADPSKKYTHVGVIHHETTAGTLNPINAIGNDIRNIDPEITFIVDSMSGFGAYDINVHEDNVHYLVSSANKNIEGIPGFSFAICDWDRLQKQGVHARTLSLDLLDQIKALNATGQFRFTPPTHSMLAFAQALVEHKAEGGQPARLARYTANFETLRDGMREMGFETYLPADKQGVIISTFLFPDDPNFNFQHLYQSLSDRGMVIYPGKLTKADCFRIGTIGQIYPYDIRNLLAVFKEILVDMGVKLPVKQIDPENATSKMASFA
eukprot:gnl/MRDRNA2_/MRDRNA2_40106_c0_seq1.p1 gnl/MRDRNA2_/MRDRNA2_40106_c0~~gnl/MRDRNA2_/MRDRNA2_40106_c0_seq1.p1  ORF type:complete len:453 (+),score=81.40 gnl/MRDRNA2_/MRDRNA2_40106_c0_seq1:165-1361(+)